MAKPSMLDKQISFKLSQSELDVLLMRLEVANKSTTETVSLSTLIRKELAYAHLYPVTEVLE